MRIPIDYGIHRGETYKTVSRKAWTLAVAVACQARLEEIKAQIDQARKKAKDAPLYHPLKRRPCYGVPRLAADLKIEPTRAWWYVQTYGKETEVCHAVKKFLEWKGLNYKVLDCFKDWTKEHEERSCLDPAFTISDDNEEETGKRLIEELGDINYHTEAGQLQELLEKEEFSINDLSASTQKEILDRHRYWNVDDDNFWAECLEDDFKEKLEALGFTDPKLHWDVSFCQGSGASFESGIDLAIYIRRNIKPLIQAKTDIFTLRRMLKVIEGKSYDEAEDWEVESAAITQRDSRYFHHNTWILI